MSNVNEAVAKDAVAGQGTDQGWKKLGELTRDEVRVLPRAKMEVRYDRNLKTGRETYKAILVLLGGKLSFSWFITQSAFYVIQKVWGRNGVSVFDVKAPYRLVHGITKNDKGGQDYSYYYVETLPIGVNDFGLQLNHLLVRDELANLTLNGDVNDKTIFQRPVVDHGEELDAASDFLDKAIGE